MRDVGTVAQGVAMGNASSVQNLLGAAASGAAVVLFGALYALLLALS